MAEKTMDTANRTARDFYQKALAALERNNLDYAVEMFRQALSSEPNFVRCRKYLRATQMKRADSAGGLKRMWGATKATPLLTKGKMALSKNPMEAMEIGEQVLSEDPKNGQAMLLVAEGADAANFPETTVLVLEDYVKMNPKDTKTLHWLAKTYAKVENFETMREVYDRILKVDPADFEAQRGAKDATARGAMADGGWNKAESYRDVIKDKKQSVELEQESRVVKAEDMIENLIKQNLAKLSADPESVTVQRELGKLYVQKKDFDTALKYLEAIYEREGGEDPSLEKELSEIRTKRVDVRINAKKQELAAQPANAAVIEAEIAGLEKERTSVMLADAERLVDRYPNDLMYRFDLGVLYMKAGDVNKAIEQFQKSVGQPQRRVASLNYLGQCFEQCGLHDLAIDQYSKAIEELPMMDGLKKELLYNLGTAYDAIGEQEKAVAEYKKIAAVDFSFRDVREKITRKAPPKTG